MGGFILVSPDYPPFPINAEQLHYLVEHGHVEFPTVTKAEIKAMNKMDGMSKIITLWQVFWFTTTELHRARLGLPMTVFELTALSFSLTMLVTSVCWYNKPSISKPISLLTKHGKSVEEIRAAARHSTHPNLPHEWYRTPLDFVSPYRRFRLDVHWSYYEHITYLLHLPLFSREITARPWDRLPSKAFLVIERKLLPLALVVLVAYSAAPLVAWNFYFPTHGERLAWRICGVYHAVFSMGLGLYYVVEAWRVQGKVAKNGAKWAEPPFQVKGSSMKGGNGVDVEVGEAVGSKTGSSSERARDMIQRVVRWLRSWRNISPDGDPDMTIGLRATIPPFIGTFVYLICRTFFYVEDFISIREQPRGVYMTVNKFLPFLGA